MVVRIRGGAPGDLMLSPTSPPGPAVQPQQAAQGSAGTAGTAGGHNSANAGTPPAVRLSAASPPVRAEVRWNMVFTWQAPMMLLSYSLIGFIMGLTICVLTPLYDGRDYDDACKVFMPLVSHFVFCFSVAETALCTDCNTVYCLLSLRWRYLCVVLFLGVYVY